jgi:multiple sugar transport system ATP-binding protein
VTHDQVEAMTLADRIVVLNAGRIEQVGTPLELYHRPANLFVAGFIGSPQMNFMECQIAGIGPDEVLVSLPSGGTLAVPVALESIGPGDPVTLGVRPDHVRVSPRGPLSGRVELVEELGENHLLYVDVGLGRRVTVREPGDARHEVGTTVSLDLAREFCHLFDRSGEALPSRTDGASPAPSSPDLTSAA